MIRVEGLNVLRGGFRPVVDDRDITSLAAWLVAELPSENGGAVPVATHDSSNVGLILRLDRRIGEPVLVRAATKVVKIDLHPSVIIPVIGEHNYKLGIVGFRGLDSMVQKLETIGARVDGGLTAVLETLEPDGRIVVTSLDVVEACYADNLQTSRGHIAHDFIRVGAVGVHAKPISSQIYQRIQKLC